MVLLWNKVLYNFQLLPISFTIGHGDLVLVQIKVTDQERCLNNPWTMVSIVPVVSLLALFHSIFIYQWLSSYIISSCYYIIMHMVWVYHIFYLSVNDMGIHNTGAWYGSMFNIMKHISGFHSFTVHLVLSFTSVHSRWTDTKNS